jgi:hypothetical protein
MVVVFRRTINRGGTSDADDKKAYVSKTTLERDKICADPLSIKSIVIRTHKAGIKVTMQTLTVVISRCSKVNFHKHFFIALGRDGEASR